MSGRRYGILDSIRGIVLVSMILYHGAWDMVYIFQIRWDWYRSGWAHLWQQSICWSFILLSGFCWSLGRRQLRRGAIVFAAGALVSLVTWLFMPDNIVIFGVLTFLGSAMMLMVPLHKCLEKIGPMPGIILSFGMFVLTRDINSGFLGFGSWRLVDLPREWYANLLTTFLGFRKMVGFYSTDYFSLFPWFFLFLTGFFLYKLAMSIGKRWDFWRYLEGGWFAPIQWLGRHSLVIYLLHQPVIYGILYVYFRIVK